MGKPARTEKGWGWDGHHDGATEENDPCIDDATLTFINDEVAPHLSDAKCFIEEHPARGGPFRVSKQACQAAAAELGAVAATLRACDATTPMSVASSVARRGVKALRAWTDAPGHAQTLAMLGDPSSPESEFRALADEVKMRLRGGDAAVDAVREAAEAAGRGCAAEACERLKENLNPPAAACARMTMDALPSRELAIAAEALEALVGTGRGRDDTDAAAASLARALVPTLFAPLLGAPGRVPESVAAAAAATAATWSEGECVVVAAGQAVHALGGAGEGAGVCTAAIIEHIPASSNMAHRVAEAAAEQITLETARSAAAAPSGWSLVERLTQSLIAHTKRHVREIVGAVVVADKDNKQAEYRSDSDSDDDGGGKIDAVGAAAFAAVLGALERDTMYIALQAVDSVAADARARFTVAAEGAAEIAAKKMRGLLTPIITATNHGWKFRIVALKGAEGRLRDLASEVKKATEATALLNRLARVGRPPSPSPERAPAPAPAFDAVVAKPPTKKRSSLKQTNRFRADAGREGGDGGGGQGGMMTLAAAIADVGDDKPYDDGDDMHFINNEVESADPEKVGPLDAVVDAGDVDLNAVAARWEGAKDAKKAAASAAAAAAAAADAVDGGRSVDVDEVISTAERAKAAAIRATIASDAAAKASDAAVLAIQTASAINDLVGVGASRLGTINTPVARRPTEGLDRLASEAGKLGKTPSTQEKRVAFSVPAHQDAGSMSVADVESVAASITDLCESLSIDLPQSAVRRFKEDLTRCPRSIAQVLSPLAQNLPHLKNILDVIRTSPLISPTPRAKLTTQRPGVLRVSGGGDGTPRSAALPAPARLSFGDDTAGEGGRGSGFEVKLKRSRPKEKDDERAESSKEAKTSPPNADAARRNSTHIRFDSSDE